MKRKSPTNIRQCEPGFRHELISIVHEAHTTVTLIITLDSIKHTDNRLALNIITLNLISTLSRQFRRQPVEDERAKQF